MEWGPGGLWPCTIVRVINLVWFDSALINVFLLRRNRDVVSVGRDIVYNGPDINVYIPSRVDRVQSHDDMCHGIYDFTNTCVKGSSYGVLNRTSTEYHMYLYSGTSVSIPRSF